MTTFADIQRDLGNANTAREAHKAALLEFNAACMCGDWERAERCRMEAVGHQEAYLDHMVAAYKRSKADDGR